MSPPADAALLKALEVKGDLDAHVKECALRQRRLEEILGEIKDELVGDIKSQLKEMREGLQAERVAMEKRVRSLEDDRTEAKGGWKYLLAAGAAGGAVMGGLISFVKTVMPFLGSVIR